MKDARRFLDGYVRNLARLTYAADALSLGVLESDSADDTFAALAGVLAPLRARWRRVESWKQDFGYRLPPATPRWAPHVQLMRRAVLARSRNRLLMRSLGDEEWVLWLDVDVIDYPADIVERLLAAGRSIVQPHCVLDYGGPTFDRNAWRDHGRFHMDALRDEGDLVKLDTVGGAMLLVRADLHRDGLVFPPYPYGRANLAARPGQGELETEGFGLMARAMGHQCWGMPNLEIRHARA